MAPPGAAGNEGKAVSIGAANNAAGVALNRPVPAVVAQHAEESAVLFHVRARMVDAPHVKLHHLRRLDDRLAAHLDGLAVAGAYGAHLCATALAMPGPGELFATTALALDTHDGPCLDKVLALAHALPECRPGVLAAFAWVPAPSLRGITGGLLASPSAFHRMVGILACRAHRVDPGAPLVAALGDPDSLLREQALRTAGECGRLDLQGACVRALADEDAACRFQAARSAVLLGDRHAAIRVLHEETGAGRPYRAQAIGLLLKLASPEQAVPILKSLFESQADARELIRGLGTSGDPRWVPWLIDRMEDASLSRLAGEAFTLITGLDLAEHDLERRPPDGIETGPVDDPADDDVAMDEDDGLPWPDAGKVADAWAARAPDFPEGVRHFMGAPPSWDHAIQVRARGCQRQRRAASEYLCLLRPGTALFPTGAPAWRQQRWLAGPEA
nr:TIGR02270 family protein [Variovorax sp. SG517]